jgi:hypothetical protein
MQTPRLSPDTNKGASLPTHPLTAEVLVKSGPPRGIKYWKEFGIWLVGLVAIHAILFFPAYHGDHIDAQTAGVFGDFVGGYLGQIIALTGLCFLIGTFRTEIARAKRERFENRYFELLQLHRANVEELELQKAKGRKVFVLMLREWRCILNIVRREAQLRQETLTQLQLVQISYYCLFYGVGPNSSRMLRAYLSDHDQELVNALELRLNDKALKIEVKKDRKLGYLPFEGHQSRLGHYYRHLYQMVRFVESNTSELADALEHMRTIRAQLSTHEQALLLLNSLTPMGGAWWNKNLIDRYSLVHNIPKEFFDPCSEFDLSKLFDPEYFERVEQHARVFPSMDVPFKRASSFEGPSWRDAYFSP